MHTTALLLAILVLTFTGAGISVARDTSETTSDQFAMRESGSSRERRFVALVSARSEAISTAFGPLFEHANSAIYIEFSNDMGDNAALYDPTRHALVFRRSLLGSIGFDEPPWAKAYWPYYQNKELQMMQPAVEIIDDALWLANLQELAHRKGVSWPHAGCSSTDLSQRLGCEMLIEASQAPRRVPGRAPQIFNENRMDLFWPVDLRELKGRSWRTDDTAYRNVQRFGGLLLVRPLIAEFGLPRVLQYIAQTPFRIEQGNVHASALRYQEQARQALTPAAIN